MLWLFYVLIAVVLMSFTVFIVKRLSGKVNPLLILFYQYLVAIPLVFIYSSFIGVNVTTGSPLFILIGVIYFIAIGSSYTAFHKGPLSRVSPIVNLKMVVTVVLSLVVLLEPLTIQLVVGLSFGVLGVYFLGGESK